MVSFSMRFLSSMCSHDRRKPGRRISRPRKMFSMMLSWTPPEILVDGLDAIPACVDRAVKVDLLAVEKDLAFVRNERACWRAP